MSNIKLFLFSLLLAIVGYLMGLKYPRYTVLNKCQQEVLDYYQKNERKIMEDMKKYFNTQKINIYQAVDYQHIMIYNCMMREIYKL